MVEYLINKTGKKNLIYLSLFSLALSAALIFQQEIVYSGNVADNYTVNYFKEVSLTKYFLLLPVAAIIFAATLLLLHVVEKIRSRSAVFFVCDITYKQQRKVFILSFAGLTFMWGIYLITYYPGNPFHDSAIILRSPLWAEVHPVAYTMFFACIVRLGQSIAGNINAGYAWYSFVQLLLTTTSISYCIAWLRKKGCPVSAVAAIWCWFGLLPSLAAIVSFGVKDVLFSAVFLLFVPLLYDLVESRGKLLSDKSYMLKLAGVCAGTILLRYNGQYVVAAVLLIVLVLYPRQKAPIVAVCFAGLIAPVLLNTIYLSATRQEKLFQETIGIPLQQIAMTVTNDGEMTSEQEKFVYSIYPKEAYMEYYAPMTLDTLKWSPNPYESAGRMFLQQNKGEFLQTWLTMLPRNLPLYIKAYLMETYGYWSIQKPSSSGAYFADSASSMHGIYQEKIWPGGMQHVLKTWYDKGDRMLSEGTLFWLTLFLGLCAVTSANPKRFLVWVPIIAVWGTLMISAPIAFSMRYVYGFIFSLPFLFCISVLLPDNIKAEDMDKCSFVKTPHLKKRKY